MSAALWLAASGHARGQVTNEAIAEAMFQEGKRAMEQGRFAEACPKLAESQRLDPGGGTQLLLAQCYEKLGKTATAWTIFNDALATSRKANRQDRERIARERVQALEARLARVTIRVDPAISSLSGFALTLDGTPINQVVFGVPFPVDPGPHEIIAAATGYQTSKQTITVSQEGERVQIVIPPLAREAPAAPAASLAPAASAAPTAPPPASTAPPVLSVAPTAPSSDPASWRRPVGYGALGLGGASIVVGSLLVLTAKSRFDDSRKACPSSPCSDEAAVNQASSARSLGNAATVLWGVGLVSAGLGTWLLVTTPSHPTTSVAIGPGALSIRGSF